MSNADIENALHHVAALRGLLSYPGGRGHDTHVLAALELLFGSMKRSLTDCACQRHLRELRGFARTLYSGEESRQSRQAGGRDRVCAQILRSLHALEARIGHLSRCGPDAAANDAIVPIRSNHS